MKVSLIITTYNWKEALELSLLSALNQTILPDEILIADDGSREDTKELIEKISSDSIVKIKHVWQEDKGFRAAMARNKAAFFSNGEYLIFIDGDVILHKEFINDHIKNAAKGYFVQGSRVLFTKKKTEIILREKKISFNFFERGMRNRQNCIYSKILSKIFSREAKGIKGIRTCNFALWKEDLIKVNGFNEDFNGWGREDSELAVRLLNSGIKRRNIKFAGIVYHLYHNENTREYLEKNDEILQNTIKNKLMRCNNGIDKYYD